MKTNTTSKLKQMQDFKSELIQDREEKALAHIIGESKNENVKFIGGLMASWLIGVSLCLFIFPIS